MKIAVLKQPIMRKVLYSLIPVILFSIYLFGWNVLVLLLVGNFTAYLTEWLFQRSKPNGKVSEAAFVTATLFTLTLPPTIPFWIVMVGTAFAISFGKMVFGGFGMNPFNPAILGRTFVYVSFPQQMTVSWVKPFLLSDFPGGFTHYSTTITMKTGATILSHFRNTGTMLYSLKDTFLGFEPGSIGETSVVLLVAGGIFMILSKTANWKPMVATTLSMLAFNLIFHPHQNPLYFLFSAGAMFGIIYMTTDPVSQPKGRISIWIYGILIGFLTVFIRTKSLFYEGFMFALLMTNSFMPIIEYGLDSLFPPKKAKVA